MTITPAFRLLSHTWHFFKHLGLKFQLPSALQSNLTARVSHIILLTFLISMVPVELVQLIVPETPVMIHVSNLILMTCLGLLVLLLRTGRVRLAQILFVSLGGVIMLLDNVTNERPLTTANLIGPSLIICSALALNRKAVVLSTLISLAAITAGLVWWEMKLLTATQERWLVQNFIGYAVAFAFIGFISYIMVGHLRKARSRMDETDQQLVERNAALEREITERQYAEQRAQRMSTRLRAAIDATNELVGLESMDELWQRAVELAREQLGIERCAIFVRNPHTGQVWGTYGTDMNGATTDERAHLSVGMTDFWQISLKKRWLHAPWVCEPTGPLTQVARDQLGTLQIGTGWVVSTCIAAQAGVPFAVMCNDTAISGAALDEGQQDALAVYCSIVGHLAERKLLENNLRQQAAQQAALSERHRLARDLHDSVSQALFGIVMGVNTARQMLTTTTMSAQAAQPLEYVLQLSQAAMAELRALIFELRPESLEQDGLLVALNKQASALLLRHKIEVVQDLGAVEPQIDFAVKEELYRIGIETVQNIIKHAQATQVQMALRVLADEMWLEINDNGIGFDAAASYPGHLGLMGMRERAKAFNGALKIVSMPGFGTTVRVTLPLRVVGNKGWEQRSGKMG